MAPQKNKKDFMSEFRQDLVSGDWILLAPKRGERFGFKERAKVKLAKNKCPFENPAKFGNAPAVLVYQNKKKDDWFLQVIPNKYPAVGRGNCEPTHRKDLHKMHAGTGFHEIVIYRDHNRYLADFIADDIKNIAAAFQDRYKSLAEDKCIEYISIFHNHGKEAGSTVPHPHSQILAMPIIPPDVSHSINGSRRYFNEYGKCVHCQMLAQELKEGERVIYENNGMVVIAPFASRTNFEIRIFPKKHSAYFEKAGEQELAHLADALKFSLSKINKKLKDPAFNFFIHTAPAVKSRDYSHYHWHVEILPKFGIFGGFELGTGMDIITMAPEKAAEILRK
ncbi:HIT domain-containing protein [Candidatus Azambacteria bacterium]|nr:HIT domain-containing protein [Candidatus Azambacteria bacterium]